MFDVDPQETLSAARAHALQVLLNETIPDPAAKWADMKSLGLCCFSRRVQPDLARRCPVRGWSRIS